MTYARPGEARFVLEELLEIEDEDCVLWPFGKYPAGYGVIGDGNGRMVGVHRIACERHYGPRPEGMQVAHSCGIPACLNYRHLRWATQFENFRDEIRRGKTKLTEADVLAIRRRLAAGEQRTQLAKAYGVSRSTICHIATGYHWSWVA